MLDENRAMRARIKRLEAEQAAMSRDVSIWRDRWFAASANQRQLLQALKEAAQEGLPGVSHEAAYEAAYGAANEAAHYQSSEDFSDESPDDDYTERPSLGSVLQQGVPHTESPESGYEGEPASVHTHR